MTFAKTRRAAFGVALALVALQPLACRGSVQIKCEPGDCNKLGCPACTDPRRPDPTKKPPESSRPSASRPDVSDKGFLRSGG
jgi:hypothetical protein